MMATKDRPTPNALTPPAGTVPTTTVASRLGITRATIWNWFKTGEIQGWQHPINRLVYIYESEIERKLREAGVAPPTRRRKSD